MALAEQPDIVGYRLAAESDFEIVIEFKAARRARGSGCTWRSRQAA
jgi:hypothetical protein